MSGDTKWIIAFDSAARHGNFTRPAARARRDAGDTMLCVALDPHAAVKTLTDTGASEPLAVAVVDVAREAGTEAAGELVTRAHFDTARVQLESRLVGRLVTAAGALAAGVVAALRFVG